MTPRSLCATALAATALIAATALPLPVVRAAQPAACIFEKYVPVAAVPYSEESHLDYGSYTYLSGAQLFVPASEGLTKEWLTASVQRSLSQGGSVEGDRAASPACKGPLVKDVTVSVVSAGNGFWVQLVGRDHQSSQALLRWAKSVVDPHTPARTASR